MNTFGKTLAAIGALGLSACTNAENGVADNYRVKPLSPSQLISTENKDHVDILPDKLVPLFQEALVAMGARLPDIEYPDSTTIASCDFLDKWDYNPYTKEYLFVAIEVRHVRGAINNKLGIRVTNDSGIVTDKYVFPYDSSPIIVISNHAIIEARLQQTLEGVVSNCSLEARI